MRRAARIDANHTEIVRTLESMGCSVQDLSRVGEGCPDILVGVSGRNILMEIKDGRKVASERKLNKRQEEWHAAWRGQRVVVESREQAIEIINELRRGREAT